MNVLTVFFTLFCLFVSVSYGYVCDSKAKELFDRIEKGGALTLPEEGHSLMLSGPCYTLTRYKSAPFVPNHALVFVYSHQGNLYYNGSFSFWSKSNGYKDVDVEKFGRNISQRQKDASQPFNREDFFQEAVERFTKAAPLAGRELALCEADPIEKKNICRSTKDLSKQERAFCQASDEGEMRYARIQLCMAKKITAKQVVWESGNYSYQWFSYDREGNPILGFSSANEIFFCELTPHPIRKGDDLAGEVDKDCLQDNNRGSFL